MARASLQNVRLSYDNGVTWALDGLTLEIAKGERLCVLGANGSGKSTLAQVLCGLEAPDEGTVELGGMSCFDGTTPLSEAYRTARQNMGLVFQNPEDQIVTSIAADDVAFGPENLGVEHDQIVERVEDELARVALSSYADADPSRLSGGQQQRLAIAGALAKHGDLLVLDEPGAMLDVRGRRGIMRVLDELQAAGITIVHITHFLDEVRAADRVIVMKAGRIVLEGSPADVLHNRKLLEEASLIAPKDSAVTDKAPAPSPDTQSTPALSAQNVSFCYDAHLALQNISFSVAQGSTTALIGHTGSGKSTLARLICALAQPSSGEIRVCGIATNNKKQRRALRGTIGYVMQMPERQLFAQTVYEDIAFGPRNMHIAEAEIEKRAEELLGLFGLSAKRDISPFELSGGQQRLVALAGILAMNPQVLVLDEPTAGLDPAGAARIKRLICQLRARSNTTILLITHSMEDVAELADHVLVLDHGTLALEGTTSEIFAQAELLHNIGLGVPGAKDSTSEVSTC